MVCSHPPTAHRGAALFAIKVDQVLRSNCIFIAGSRKFLVRSKQTKQKNSAAIGQLMLVEPAIVLATPLPTKSMLGLAPRLLNSFPTSFIPESPFAPRKMRKSRYVRGVKRDYRDLHRWTPLPNNHRTHGEAPVFNLFY